MAVQILGCGVYDDVGAQIVGLADETGSEGVIDDADAVGVLFVSDLADLLQIDDLHGRVGDGLAISHLGLLAKSFANCTQISEIDEFHIDSPLRKLLREQFERTAVQSFICDQSVALLQEGNGTGRDSAHAGRGSNCALGVLQDRQLLFDLRGGGAAQTSVDVTGFLTGESVCALLGALELVRRCLENRHLEGSERIHLVLVAMNQSCSHCMFFAHC